ncbi:tyrosine-type recombinase/integrase [Nakamurella antarctica]|nr:tyrosine-type recombinase/integrase [Nakamurella antarctica]
MARPALPIGTWGVISRTRIDANKWRARTRYRDADGSTRDISVWAESASKAERELRMRLVSRETPAGTDISADMTVTRLSEVWMEEILQEGKAHNTIQRYNDVVRRYILPGIGGLRMRECTVSRIDRFVKDATEQGSQTRHHCRTVLSGMLGLAVRHGALTTNPMRDISRPTPKPAAVNRILTLDEIAAVRLAARELGANEPGKVGRPKSFSAIDLVDVLLGTGARIGEVLAVRWMDIDLGVTPATLTIRGTVVRKGKEGLVIQEHPKTPGSVRTVSLPAFVFEMLERRRAEESLSNPFDLVFPSSDGTIMDPVNAQKQWRKVRTAAGLEWATYRTFRKTVASLIDSQSSTKAAAAQLGHSTTTTTTRHYVHRSNVAPDLANLLNELVRPVGGAA